MIALHKVFVTVRQMFSDDPAGKNRVLFSHFGGDPFPQRRPPGLAKGYWWVPRLYLSDSICRYPTTQKHRCQEGKARKWRILLRLWAAAAFLPLGGGEALRCKRNLSDWNEKGLLGFFHKMKTFQKFYKFKILLTGYQILLEKLFLFPAAFEKARENWNNSGLKITKYYKLLTKSKEFSAGHFPRNPGLRCPFGEKLTILPPLQSSKKYV